MLRTIRVLSIGTVLLLGAVTGAQAALPAQPEQVAESAGTSKCGCCRYVRVWTGCCWVWVRVCD